MPDWVAYILGVAALIAALGVIWNKVVVPAYRFMIAVDRGIKEMLPLLQTLTTVFKDHPDALARLDDMQSQFKADDGSSLRDVVDRLDEAAKLAQANAESLKIGVEAVKQVAALDRERIERLTILLDRTGVQLTETVSAVHRIEMHASGVADDLAAAHKRADAVDSEDAGSAADAAARQTERERREDAAS